MNELKRFSPTVRWVRPDQEVYNADIVDDYLAKHLPKWVSVEDRLPDDFKLVIVSQLSAVFTGTCEAGEWFSGSNLGIQAPEYWMPLPEAPKEVSDE